MCITLPFYLIVVGISGVSKTPITFVYCVGKREDALLTH